MKGISHEKRVQETNCDGQDRQKSSELSEGRETFTWEACVCTILFCKIVQTQASNDVQKGLVFFSTLSSAKRLVTIWLTNVHFLSGYTLASP